MVGGTQALAQSQPQSQPPSTSAEEEALKRNTDCVYFLASPLTCKKGSECEYRHSEIARINPRDCWYWLNGNCLNPKCAFRHPPLDGLLGAQVPPTPTGSSLPPPQTAVKSAPHGAPPVSISANKQPVPCIFFQKGLCLKGDRCAFMHAPNPTHNKPPQMPAIPPVSDQSTVKKPFVGGLERCNQKPNMSLSQENPKKTFEFPSLAKQASRVETAGPAKNGPAIVKNVPPPPSALDDEVHRYRPAIVPPATIGNPISRSNNRVHQAHVSDDHNILNGKETDEFSRELSPGFDVLVDDERGDSDYYHNEDQYVRTRSHEGRNLSTMNEYDLGHPTNYSSVADVDQELYHDPRGYDAYDHTQGGQYGAWDQQRRPSSERMLGGSAHNEKRRYPRDEVLAQIDGSDLRHRLLKQRNVNGLRSVVSHDYARDDHHHVLDQSYKGNNRREAHHESSVASSRLRGRIKLPGRSTSPVDGVDMLPEMEMNRGRSRGRLSPTRPQMSSRIRDRIKGRVQEDFNNETRNSRGLLGRREDDFNNATRNSRGLLGRREEDFNNETRNSRGLLGRREEDFNNEMRNSRGLLGRRDMMNDSGATFAGPKRLSELKVGKNTESNEHFLGKRKYPSLEGNHQSGGELSFEGPKPLSVILKKKRETGTGSSKDSDNQKERLLSSIAAATDKEQDNLNNDEKVVSEDVQQLMLDNNVEQEEGMIVDDEAMADNEPEAAAAFEQREDGGDSEYEQEEEEYENVDGDGDGEDYLDDDDGDDFAKKIGVMFS